MNPLVRLWKHPNGYYYIELERNRRHSWSLRQGSRRFQQLCARVGIEARLHDLRHTYGSYMAMAGVDLLTIGKSMGHRSLRSTEIYAHLSPEHLALAQTKLANALNLRIVPGKDR